MINDQCRIARDRFLVYILSRCFLPFFGPDIMLPIACAARSFWLEGQSTIDHRQDVTTDPWHHSYDFKSGKQHNLNINTIPLFHSYRERNLQPETAFLSIHGRCVFAHGQKRTFCLCDTRVFCLCLFQEFLTRKLYPNKFELYFFCFFFFFMFRNFSFRLYGEICVKHVDVIRHFLSKVSRSTLQVRDITVRSIISIH